MKMKFIFSLLFMAFLLSACSEDSTRPGIKEDTEEKAVFLKIAAKKQGKIRADEPSMTADTAEIKSALIYFLDGSADPVIYAVRTVGTGSADITVGQLEEGYMFEGIPSSTTQVYVVGNYNSTDDQGTTPTFPTRVGQTLSEIQEVVWNIQQVSHGSLLTGATYGVLITVLDGLAPLEEYDTNPTGWNGDIALSAGDVYANVVISPIVARIEIEEIQYTGDLMSFTLEGIYINYYYANKPLSLDNDGYALTNNGSNPEAYDSTSDDFAYERYTTLFDQPNLPVNGAAREITEIFIPENGTWAYQIFGNSTPAHIILKLTGVVDAGGNYLGDRFVTVNGFLNGGNRVTTFARNTIYKIESLAFTDEDINIIPEPEAISLWVHVEVEPWETIIVTPIIE